MMPFDMLTKRKLFDALWERGRKGQPAPSLRLIVKECRLADEAAAERLLRDMAADGAISIVGEIGEYPWLTLRRTVYKGDFITVPVWLERERADKRTLVPEMDEAPVPKFQLPDDDSGDRVPTYEDGPKEPVRRRSRLMTDDAPINRIMSVLKGNTEPQPKRDAVSVAAERHFEETVVPAVEKRLAIDPGSSAPAVIVDEVEEYPGASGTSREDPGAVESSTATRIEDRAPPMPERPEVETVEAQREGTPTRSPSPASVDQGPKPACPPAQAAEGAAKRDAEPLQAVEARQPFAMKAGYPRGGVRAPSNVAPFTGHDKQVNMKLPAHVHAALSSRAELEGGGVGTVARTIFLEAFTAAECDTNRKHKLKASVLRAWRDDGRTLDAFVTDLIDLGLESYLAFRNQAEAAE